MIVDFIELSSDEEGDNTSEERVVHGQGHSVQVKGEVIDLTTEDIFEAPHHVHGHADAAQNTISQSWGFNAKDGQGEVAQCKQEFVADNGQGGAAHNTPATQRLDSIREDGQGNAAHCTSTPQRQGSIADGQGNAAHCTTIPQRQGSIVDGQSDAVHCTATPQSLGSTAYGQSNAAHCITTPQRTDAPATHGQSNAAQCTNTSHNQDLLATVDSIQEAMQSGSAAEATTSLSRTQERHRTNSLLNLPPAPPFPRQFSKAGEYRLSAQDAINDMLLTLLCVDRIHYAIVGQFCRWTKPLADSSQVPSF
ncbi:hypothetical protein QOZ80_6BG0473170 [Eleusine coracana subsp. coracana]|nr:hypothetical protein QOZ80_6BG0473170 [Eleusine coracana subsp. coracana]